MSIKLANGYRRPNCIRSTKSGKKIMLEWTPNPPARITISLSTSGYQSKPSKAEYSRMSFARKSLELSQMSIEWIIRQGYAISPNMATTGPTFSIAEKTNENFDGTQVIPIDIDGFEEMPTIDDMVSLLKGQLPIYEIHTSLSYGRKKHPTDAHISRGYHILIIADRPMVKEEFGRFLGLVNEVLSDIDTRLTADSNAFSRPCQMYLGGNQDSLCRHIGQVLHVPPIQYLRTFPNVFEHQGAMKGTKAYNFSNIKKSDLVMPSDKEFIDELKTCVFGWADIPDFICRQQRRGHQLITSTPMDIKFGRSLGKAVKNMNKLNTFFFRLDGAKPVPAKKGYKIKDGSHRHKQLIFKAITIKNKIYPAISIEDLILTMLWLAYEKIDTSNISVAEVVNQAMYAYVYPYLPSMTDEDGTPGYYSPKFMCDERTAIENGLNIKLVRNKIQEAYNAQIVRKYMDESLTTNQNLQLIHEKTGWKISRNTFLKHRGSDLSIDKLTVPFFRRLAKNNEKVYYGKRRRNEQPVPVQIPVEVEKTEKRKGYTFIDFIDNMGKDFLEQDWKCNAAMRRNPAFNHYLMTAFPDINPFHYEACEYFWEAVKCKLRHDEAGLSKNRTLMAMWDLHNARKKEHERSRKISVSRQLLIIWLILGYTIKTAKKGWYYTPPLQPIHFRSRLKSILGRTVGQSSIQATGLYILPPIRPHPNLLRSG